MIEQMWTLMYLLDSKSGVAVRKVINYEATGLVAHYY